jgi:hypothetical protein
MTRSGRIGLVLFLAVCFLNGCAISQLNKFKDHSREKNYAWIAAQTVSCQPLEEGCNQLHLIKGDACYRLAQDKTDERKNYQCAVSELETGIAQTQQWEVGDLPLNRAQTYENLCESIRNLQDLESGAAAEELTNKLLFDSKQFLSAEPGNLAAIYFLNSARLTLLRRCLLHPENCPSACDNLKAIGGEVDKAMPAAAQTRYEANYHRLHEDIEAAKRSLAGCR